MSARPLSVVDRCRACGCRLAPDDPRDGVNDHLCADCRKHPGARRPPPLPRDFTAADKALIANVHGYMPAAQLLSVLNERLLADTPEASPHTMEQLHAALQLVAVAPTGSDWAALRKLIGQARRDGVIAKVGAQTIADFAVVYSLTPAQVLRLKDAVLSREQP